jgi:valyl-tRNA synthetase
MDNLTYTKTIEQLEKILKLLHPFMPFLSEEIWHLIDDRKEDIIVANWPKATVVNEHLLADFKNTTDVVAGIRTIRKEQNIANKEQLELLVIDNQKSKTNLDAIITKLGNLSAVKPTDKKPTGAFSFMVKANEYFIPLGDNIDVAAEIEKLQKELDYTTGFLKMVEEKLSNDKFVKNAPQQLVDNEQNKLADAKAKIKILTTKIKDLANA